MAITPANKVVHGADLQTVGAQIKSAIANGVTRMSQSIPFGEVDSTSTETAFTATVDGITALADGVSCYLKNGVVTSAAAATTPKCWTLNINNLGAKPVYVTTAAATYSTTQFTKNYKMLFTYDSSLNSGGGGWYIGILFNSNTTYSDMSQAEIDAGTGTTGRKLTPKMLRDNFYTEDEVDGLLAAKADSADIPTVPTKVSDLTNDAGYISGYTETDPTVPAWAKAASKPTYTASEVGALPSTTSIPSALSDLSDDSTHRVVTDAEKATWNGKYTKPSTGIPASDLAAGVIPTVTPEVFWATRGTTTYAEVLAAYNAGKLVCVNHSGIVFVLSSYNSTDSEFLFASCNAEYSIEFLYLHSEDDEWESVGTPLAGTVSPTFTGTPKAPTAATGTNTTQIATTAFVQNAVSSMSVPTAATSNPLMDGTAAVGSSTKYAKEDHVHPSDTSKANVNNPVFNGRVAVENVDDSFYIVPASHHIGYVGEEEGEQQLVFRDLATSSTIQMPASSGTLALTSDVNTAVSGKEDTSNKVTSLSSSSTDTQYPSAKAVYDMIGDVESALAALL